MARRRSRTRTIVRRVARAASRRRPRRREGEMYAKKILKGVGAGLAVAVPLSLFARYSGRPELFELGERAGAVAASKFGGTWGQVGFQAADAMVERVIPRIAGGPGGGIGRLGELYP